MLASRTKEKYLDLKNYLEFELNRICKLFAKIFQYDPNNPRYPLQKVFETVIDIIIPLYLSELVRQELSINFGPLRLRFVSFCMTLSRYSRVEYRTQVATQLHKQRVGQIK